MATEQYMELTKKRKDCREYTFRLSNEIGIVFYAEGQWLKKIKELERNKVYDRGRIMRGMMLEQARRELRAFPMETEDEKLAKWLAACPIGERPC